MSYENLKITSGAKHALATSVALALIVSGCSGLDFLPWNPKGGDTPGDASDVDPAVSRNTVAAVETGDPAGTRPEPPPLPASAARAFLDEASWLLDAAGANFDRGDYLSSEFNVKQAFDVLLEADELLPTRVQLELGDSYSGSEQIQRVTMLGLRREFEGLWNGANALYDRLLPNLNITVFTSDDIGDGEEVDLTEMNAALEGADEPAPGSWQEIRDLLLEMRADGRIDIDMGLENFSNEAWKKVYWSVEYYTGRGRKNYKIWLERSGRYRKMVEDILVEEVLPRDMVFLCMIESGFSPRAYSRAAAVGPWQFMSYTAGKFGLKTSRTDPVLDERRDFEKSTYAASRYLTVLYEEFGAWPLAMAAYNSGEGRVRGAQRWAQRNRRGLDYWSIYNRLPRETRNYVPYYLAALAIAKNPVQFGFSDVVYQTPFNELYETIHVDGALYLKDVARMTGTDEALLVELNPELGYRFSPTTGYDLRLPKGTTDRFIEELERIPEVGRISYESHVIRRGDTGGQIAEKYGMAWSEIRDHNRNRISRDTNLQVGVALQIPRYESSRYLTDREITSLTRQRNTGGSGTPVYYTVRRGDTVSGIATRYGVTWVQIRQWNGLRGDMIYTGQRLRLYSSRTVRVVAAVSTANLPANGVYTVGKYDTLWDISQKFKISVSDLKRWNGLSSNIIYPGNRLIVTREAAELAGMGGGKGVGSAG